MKSYATPLPCPAGHEGQHYINHDSRQRSFVECVDCDWCGPCAATDEEAIGAWNRRAGDDADEVRRLREALLDQRLRWESLRRLGELADATVSVAGRALASDAGKGWVSREEVVSILPRCTWAEAGMGGRCMRPATRTPKVVGPPLDDPRDARVGDSRICDDHKVPPDRWVDLPWAAFVRVAPEGSADGQ